MQGIYDYIPEQTVFLGYIMLQLFCSYNLWYSNAISHDTTLLSFTSAFSEVRAQCPIWLFSLVP